MHRGQHHAHAALTQGPHGPPLLFARCPAPRVRIRTGPDPPGPAPDPKILRPAGERARDGLAPPPGDMSEGAGASWAHFLSAPSRPAVRRPAGAWTRPADSSHSRNRVGAGRRQGRAGWAGRAAEGDARASSWAPQSGTEGEGGGGGGFVKVERVGLTAGPQPDAPGRLQPQQLLPRL